MKVALRMNSFHSLFFALTLAGLGGAKEGCQRDILLVVDGSSSLEAGFGATRNFLRLLADSLKIDSGRHRIALLEYSGLSKRWPLYTFGQIRTNTELDSVLARLPFLRGTTATGSALKKAKRILQQRRDNVLTLVFIITDGFSQEVVDGEAIEIQSMKNVLMFAIGLADNLNWPELQVLAGKDERLIAGKNVLESSKNALNRYLLCLPSKVPKPSVTKKYVQRTTLQPKVRFLLDVKTTTTQAPPPVVSGCQLDLVIVLDLSSSVQKVWRKFIDLAIELIQSLHVRPEATRVAIIKFSSSWKCRTIFDLNSRHKSRDLVAGLSNLGFMHGLTALGSALRLTERELKSSDRSVNRVVTVFTDGYSFEDPVPAAESLRHSGVDVYAITAEVKSLRPYYGELYRVAGFKDRVFSDKNFNRFISVMQMYNERC